MKFIKRHSITVFISIVVCLFSNATSSSTNVAVRLLERYNNTVKVCHDKDANVIRPAYECAGLLIRGINREQKLPHAWSMKPSNKEKQSFSVAFLRKDAPFSNFTTNNYDSGFIIYPHMMTPRKKSMFELVCAFPLNAYTDSRSDHGCGMYDDDKEGKSKPCDEQGIDSLEKWVQFFNEIKVVGDEKIDTKLCAFYLTDASFAARNFNICLEANEYLRGVNLPEYAFWNNELRMRGWEQEKAEKLPIEAFFYIEDSQNGFKTAKKYRDDYWEQSNGEIIPIVGIKLPSAEDEKLHVIPYID